MIQTTFHRRGGSNQEGKGANPLEVIVLVVWILSWILAPIMIRLMAMAVSRGRAYLATAMAAQLTRNPAAQTLNEKPGRWPGVFATHPPMALRVARVRAMAFQTGNPESP